MNTNKIIVRLLSVAALSGMLIAAGCSGGGGGSAPAAGGGPVAGVSGGQIENFGSIFVNGVEFETESAVVRIDDAPGGMDDLQRGMVVKVEGVFDNNGVTGRADVIRTDDSVEGPIAAVAETTAGRVKTMTVMGQNVVVENGVTVFDNRNPGFTFAALGAGNVGNVVEVSGIPLPDGSVQATFIQMKAVDLAAFLAVAGNTLEVEGTVLNLAGSTFKINNLTIDFTGITPRNGALADGVTAEVKGTSFDSATNTLVAADVEVKAGGMGVAAIGKAEVEGFVNDLTGSTFIIAGQLVDFSSASFRGGAKNELFFGMKVEAEGPIVGGVLMAVKVSFKESVRFEANLASVDDAAGTATLQGLPGFTIITDDNITRFGGDPDLIVVGNNLRVRGRLSVSAGTIMATRIEKQSDNPDNRLIIQGLVDSFDANSVTIMGVNVDTSSMLDAGFKGEDDVIVGRAGFMNRLKVGALVKARAAINPTTGAIQGWFEIEFED
jgi:hypothetical protein